MPKLKCFWCSTVSPLEYWGKRGICYSCGRDINQATDVSERVPAPQLQLQAIPSQEEEPCQLCDGTMAKHSSDCTSAQWSFDL